MAQKLENRWNITDSTVLSKVVANYRPLPCCGHSVSGDMKSFFLCMANLVLSTRLSVHKPSFLNLLRQNGRHMTKVY